MLTLQRGRRVALDGLGCTRCVALATPRGACVFTVPNFQPQSSHVILKVLKKYRISKLVFKTLKKY